MTQIEQWDLDMFMSLNWARLKHFQIKSEIIISCLTCLFSTALSVRRADEWQFNVAGLRLCCRAADIECPNKS